MKPDMDALSWHRMSDGFSAAYPEHAPGVVVVKSSFQAKTHVRPTFWYCTRLLCFLSRATKHTCASEIRALWLLIKQ